MTTFNRLFLQSLMLFSGLLAGLLSQSLCAQDLEQKSSIDLARAFARDTVLYSELEFEGDIKELYDLNNLEAAGMVGLGFSDLAWYFEELGFGIPSEDLAEIYKGVKRLAGGIIDITVDGPTWLAILEHESPEVFMGLLEQAAETGKVLFEESGEYEGTELYSLRYGLSLFSNFLPFSRSRNEEDFSQPLSLALWQDRYLIVASQDSDLRDALDFLEYPEEDEFSLVSSSNFRQARKETESSPFFFYWNIATTITIIERITDTRSRGMDEEVKSFLAFLEHKQFRSLTFRTDYDSEQGKAVGAFQVFFYNEPSWYKLFAPSQENMERNLATFCPTDPFLFFHGHYDEPQEFLRTLHAIVKEKSEALAQPELLEDFEASMKRSQEELGFPLEDLLALIDNEQGLFFLPPIDKFGNTQNTFAFLLELKDAEQGEAFLYNKIASLKGARPLFHHTSNREYLELSNGERIGYYVFDPSAEGSWAYCILDSVLIFGTQKALRLAIKARKENNNLNQKPEALEVLNDYGKHALVNAYVDLAFIASFSEYIFEIVPDQAYLYQDILEEAGLLEEEEKIKNRQKSDASLAAKRTLSTIFKRYLNEYRVGAALRLHDKSIFFEITEYGIPSLEELRQITLAMIKVYHYAEAEGLGENRLLPALKNYLFEHHDLPETIEEFVAGGGDKAVFRDPSLCGPAVEEPREEECFVWLGKHGQRDLLPAIPLFHSRMPNDIGEYLLFLSDGSFHWLDSETLDAIVETDQAGESIADFGLGSQEKHSLEEAFDDFYSIVAEEVR